MKEKCFSFFLFVLFVLGGKCTFSQSSNWSKLWCNYDSGRLKDALVVDDGGSLLVLGQAFTTTDSIDHPSLLALISAEGEMTKSKPMGRYGRFKGERAKTDRIGFYHENRLVELHKLPDGRMLAIGYKKLSWAKENLWIVEISKDLEVLSDSVYDAFFVSSGFMKSYDMDDGFRLIYRTYKEENELSRYNFAMLTFDSQLNCTHAIQEVTVSLNNQPAHMYWITDVIEKGGKFYFLCTLGITGPTIDEDKTERKACLVAFDPQTLESRVLQAFDKEHMIKCGAFGENGEYVLGLTKRNPEENQVVKSIIMVVGYNAQHQELWRDERFLGKYQSIDLIAFRNNKYECRGMCFADQACVFYTLYYQQDGQPVLIDFSDKEGYEKEIVREIKGVKGRSYRLCIDKGWRIDAFEDAIGSGE
jgi:hypothetical protein